MRRIIFRWFYFGLAATLTVVRVRRPTIDASSLGVFGLEVDSGGASQEASAWTLLCAFTGT